MAALAKRLDEGAGGAAGAACGGRVRPRFRCRLRSAGCGSCDRLEGPSATYTIPLAVRLTGALDQAALEAALGDVVERHESLRTIFPDTLGVPRQLILEAAAARPRLAVERGRPRPGLAEALAAAARQGFDLAREPPLRAHLFALGASEHVLLLLLHHIAGDGWSLAPLGRDLGARLCGALPRAARRSCRRCRCNMPTTRCGSTRFWARRAIRTSAIARQLAFWTEHARRAFPISSSCRPTGRGRRLRAIAATACR